MSLAAFRHVATTGAVVGAVFHFSVLPPPEPSLSLTPSSRAQTAPWAADAGNVHVIRSATGALTDLEWGVARIEPPAIDTKDPPAAMVRVTMRELLSAIDALRQLPEDWDGDGANAPSEIALVATRDILDQLGRLPDEIDPDAIGGTALWFYSPDGRRMMIGIRNNGRAVVCAYPSADSVPAVTAHDTIAEAAAAARTPLTNYAA